MKLHWPTPQEVLEEARRWETMTLTFPCDPGLKVSQRIRVTAEQRGVFDGAGVVEFSYFRKGSWHTVVRQEREA